MNSHISCIKLWISDCLQWQLGWKIDGRDFIYCSGIYCSNKCVFCKLKMKNFVVFRIFGFLSGTVKFSCLKFVSFLRGEYEYLVFFIGLTRLAMWPSINHFTPFQNLIFYRFFIVNANMIDGNWKSNSFCFFYKIKRKIRNYFDIKRTSSLIDNWIKRFSLCMFLKYFKRILK